MGRDKGVKEELKAKHAKQRMIVTLDEVNIKTAVS
jgi:hypothetical protein